MTDRMRRYRDCVDRYFAFLDTPDWRDRGRRKALVDESIGLWLELVGPRERNAAAEYTHSLAKQRWRDYGT